VRPLPPSLVDRHSAQVAIASLPGISSSLDSLFRVLCIFPLRYLCANGLLPCYLALGGIYHPPKKIIQVALSSNPTRRQPKKKIKVKNPSKGPPPPLPFERGRGVCNLAHPPLIKSGPPRGFNPLCWSLGLSRLDLGPFDRDRTWTKGCIARQQFLKVRSPSVTEGCGGGLLLWFLRILGLDSSLFTRRYWGNHGCFLFLRLLRCFNQAGYPIRDEACVCDQQTLVRVYLGSF